MVLILDESFDAAAITAFFTDANQLNLSVRTHDKLVEEGFGSLVDYPDFKASDVTALARICERPPRAPNATGNLVNQAPYAFPAKSQKRLVIAIAIAKYYDETTRQVTPDMMMWPVLKSFATQMEALTETVSPPDMTPIKSNMPMTKFLEHFNLHCGKVIGKRLCPITYVFRTNEMPAAFVPALLPYHPHSAEHGSVEAEMIARLSFNHPLHRNDSAMVYSLLSKGLQGTKFHATIVRYRNVGGQQDGRGAYMAIKTQHAGQAVWESIIRTSDDYIKTRKWNGLTSLTLESHIDGHRTAFVNLTEAAEHIAYQLPNSRTRVTQFLDSVTCADPELLAAMAAVKQDDPGMRDSFELAMTFIAPSDPVARKKQANKRPAAEISATFAEGSLRKQGATGVELRWYKRKEFAELTDAQKEELKSWAATQPDNRTGKPKGNAGAKPKPKHNALTPGSKKFKKYVNAQVAAIRAKESGKPASKKQATHDAFISAIKSLVQTTNVVSAGTAAVGSTAGVQIADPPVQAEVKAMNGAEVQLRAILKKNTLFK